jgi:hypothetical protein
MSRRGSRLRAAVCSGEEVKAEASVFLPCVFARRSRFVRRLVAVRAYEPPSRAIILPVDGAAVITAP